MSHPGTEAAVERLETRIMRLVSELTGVPLCQISPATRIREDLQADSMQVMALMIALDEEFDVAFDITQVPDAGVTVGWIREFVEATLASGN